MTIAQRIELKRNAITFVSNVITARSVAWVCDQDLEAMKAAMDILIDTPEYKWRKPNKEVEPNVKSNTDN